MEAFLLHHILGFCIISIIIRLVQKGNYQKSLKMNLIFSEIYSGIVNDLEQGSKIFQKFVETGLLKNPESIYSPIKQQNIDRRKRRYEQYLL